MAYSTMPKVSGLRSYDLGLPGVDWKGYLGSLVLRGLVVSLGLGVASLGFPPEDDILVVAFLELSHYFLRILLVKLISLVIPEDPALIKEPIRDNRGVEG